MFSQGHHQEHTATLSNDSADFARTAGQYLRVVVGHGGTGIVVATRQQRKLIEAWLTRAGTDLPAAGAGGSYLPVDADAALDRVMLTSGPDPAMFWQTFSPVLRRPGRRRRQVRVVSELGSLLRQSGRPGAAIEVEALWNELARQHRFGLLCGYPGAAGHGQDDDLVLALGEHDRVVSGARSSVDALSA